MSFNDLKQFVIHIDWLTEASSLSRSFFSFDKPDISRSASDFKALSSIEVLSFVCASASSPQFFRPTHNTRHPSNATKHTETGENIQMKYTAVSTNSAKCKKVYNDTHHFEKQIIVGLLEFFNFIL
jgi:hypothetical protein